MAQPLNPASVLTTRGPLFAAHLAIQARLQGVFPASHFQHGLLPAALTKELWSKLVRRTPYVGLTWLDMKPAANARQFRAVMSWRVVLVNTHPNPEQRMTGDRIGPGQFAMVQAAIAALHGYTPTGLADIDGFGTLNVADVTALTTEEWGSLDDAVAGIGITSEFALTDAHALAELLRLRGAWQFQGAPETAAPADLNTGAT